MTNTILDEAESRIAPAAATAKATRIQIVEAMKDEIGRSHYDQAKVELAKLKTVLTSEVHPYLSRLARLSQHAPTPLPAFILAHVNELHEVCTNGTNWVQEGLQEWDRLAPPYVKGSTRELDVNRRSEEIGSIRTKLRNWSGRESRARDLMCNINNYIQDSGWPTVQAVGGGPIVPAPAASNEILVERAC